MSVYDPWVTALFEGVDGAEVVERMRTYYRDEVKPIGQLNECTLRTKVSAVKRRFMDEYEAIARGAATRKELSPACRKALKGYRDGLAALGAAAKPASAQCRAAVAQFAALPVRDQVREVRYRDHPKRDRASLCEPFGDRREVSDAFAKLVVLPANLDTLLLHASESLRCAKHSSKQMLRREKAFVPSLDAFLTFLGATLDAPQEHKPQLVIACLLAACGRRTTELLNPRSSFAPVAGFARGCLFEGQLKTRGRARAAYKIPLLVPYATFRAALDRIRAWQGEDAAALTNTQLSVRYQGGLSRFFSGRDDFGGIEGAHPHLLRAVYMAIVLKVFDWGRQRDQRIAKYCLGHAEKETSYHYDFVEIQSGAKKYAKKFGVFPLSEAELRAAEDDDDE